MAIFFKKIAKNAQRPGPLPPNPISFWEHAEQTGVRESHQFAQHAAKIRHFSNQKNIAFGFKPPLNQILVACLDSLLPYENRSFHFIPYPMDIFQKR